MQVETRDRYGKTVVIETRDIVGNMVWSAGNWYHLSKLYYGNGTSCIDQRGYNENSYPYPRY